MRQRRPPKAIFVETPDGGGGGLSPEHLRGKGRRGGGCGDFAAACSTVAAMEPLSEVELRLEEVADSRRVLVLGGSGFISGAVVTTALNSGYDVTVVTRGIQPIPVGVHSIVADRTRPGVLENAIAEERRRTGGAAYSLVVDCIGYRPADVVQDMALFGGDGTHLVFLSDDAVYAPESRTFPQKPEGAFFVEDDTPAGLKRRCEQLFLQAGDSLKWTVLRPTLVVGAGCRRSFCPPYVPLADTIAALKAGREVMLADGGHWLVQPLDVYDLARMVLECADAPGCAGKLLDCAGPQLVEVRQLYALLASQLGVEARLAEAKEIPASERSDLCHRIYCCRGALQAAGLSLPVHTPAQAIAAMVQPF